MYIHIHIYVYVYMYIYIYIYMYTHLFSRQVMPQRANEAASDN